MMFEILFYIVLLYIVVAFRLGWYASFLLVGSSMLLLPVIWFVFWIFIEKGGGDDVA